MKDEQDGRLPPRADSKMEDEQDGRLPPRADSKMEDELATVWGAMAACFDVFCVCVIVVHTRVRECVSLSSTHT